MVIIINMEFNEMINNVLYTILTAILPVAAYYIVSLTKAKINESTIIEESVKNEIISNMIKDALSDVMDAVLHVNQTYVDSLKASGKFDNAAQNEAFLKAYTEAIMLISAGTQEIIEKVYGSFDEWLKSKIETSVKKAKTMSEKQNNV